MTPVRPVKAFRLDDELVSAMAVLRERDGVPPSEQIRRGLRLYLESKGVLKQETGSKRAATRKKP